MLLLFLLGGMVGCGGITPPPHGASRGMAGEGEGSVSPLRGVFQWPLEGTILSRFGPRGGRSHEGIDLGAPEGTPVRSAAAGRVLLAGEQGTRFGKVVILGHGGGWKSLYAHVREIAVREGERVAGGQVIATVGQTGNATTPHLHFEIRWWERPLDPLFYLPSSALRSSTGRGVKEN